MALTTAEVDKITRVLQEEISLALVATDFSLRESVLTAAAILWAGGWRNPEYKAEYGELLKALALEPGIPEDCFGDLDFFDKPEWYQQKCADALIATSRRLRVHKTMNRNGSHIRFFPPDDLRTLAQKPEFRELASRYTSSALRQVHDRRDHQQDYLRRRAALQRALRRDRHLGRQLGGELSCEDPYILWLIHSTLGRLLDEYVPEDKPDEAT